MDKALKTSNLNLIWELEEEKEFPLISILKDGDQLALKKVIGTIKSSNKPYFGVWHMDGTHSYLYPPSIDFPFNIPGKTHPNKKKYLHSAYAMTTNLNNLLKNINLSKTIVIVLKLSIKVIIKKKKKILQ